MIRRCSFGKRDMLAHPIGKERIYGSLDEHIKRTLIEEGFDFNLPVTKRIEGSPFSPSKIIYEQEYWTEVFYA